MPVVHQGTLNAMSAASTSTPEKERTTNKKACMARAKSYTQTDAIDMSFYRGRFAMYQWATDGGDTPLTLDTVS